MLSFFRHLSANFYPRPLRGGRRCPLQSAGNNGRFLSTPSARRATKNAVPIRGQKLFLSTPSARRATCGDRQGHSTGPISIHALCEEGDPAAAPPSAEQQFLSTPSARRATRLFRLQSVRVLISIHALCEEGDARGCLRRPTRQISIHALCEEGDAEQGLIEDVGTVFLSTPSARRATDKMENTQMKPAISIHALCEEGDTSPWPAVTKCRYFYPRPLRGGRHQPGISRGHPRKFLSTPSARRATYDQGAKVSHNGFLSTPSARRATAKTETKSLFSNKLYNILHEFRRALIYNGSKNDPNHAK